MKRWLAKNKRPLTVILALTGIGVTVAYALCLGACSYLTGSLLGMDLKYTGIFYMTVVIILALMRRSLLCLLLLAFGAGGEIFLIGYQTRVGVYCPFCMAFGATVILALLVNFERARKGLAALAAGAGLIFFLLFFSGTTTPAYAAASPIATFGKGPVEVRVYTDYFCGPCSNEEAEVMGFLTDMVDKNLVRVLFVDTPIHKGTPLYAGYFLSALNAKGEVTLKRAIATRAALFEAAAQNIEDKEGLERFLKNKGIAFPPFDTAPTFKLFTHYLQEDQINATPTIVIVRQQGKQKLTGKDEILKALREVREGKPGSKDKAP